MKNIFKLMGLALIAGSMMFVACNKDENENNGNGNNNQEPVVTDGIKVTFGTDVTWNATTILGQEFASYGLLQIGAYKNYESSVEPSVMGYLPNSVRTTTHVGQQDNYYMFYYENDDDVTVQGENEYPNWQPSEGFEENVTALDMNAMTISATAQGTMFYLPDYMNNITTEKDLLIEMVNAVWEAAEK